MILSRGHRQFGFGWILLLAALLLFCQPQTSRGATLREGVEGIGQDLLTKLLPDRRLSVAITEFPDLQGATSDLSRYIAERLTTIFSQSPRVSVVERRRIGQLLAELGWSQADLLDPAKAPKIGEVTGAGAVLVGTLADLGATVEVEARLLALDSGQILALATAMLPKDQSVAALLERGRLAPTRVPPEPGTAQPGQGPEAPSLPQEAGPGPEKEVPIDVSVMNVFSTPGARWKYRLSLERQEGLFFKRKVSQQGEWIRVNEGAVPFKSTTAFRIRGEHRLGGTVRPETFFYRIADGTFTQVGEEIQGPDGRLFIIGYEPPILLWKPGAKAGDEWETSFEPAILRREPGRAAPTRGGGTVGVDVLVKGLAEGLATMFSSSGTKSNTVKVLVGPTERVSVPFGDFDGWRIEFRRGAVVIVDWYVGDIGLAKRKMTGPQGQLEAELLEFSLR